MQEAFDGHCGIDRNRHAACRKNIVDIGPCHSDPAVCSSDLFKNIQSIKIQCSRMRFNHNWPVSGPLQNIHQHAYIRKRRGPGFLRIRPLEKHRHASLRKLLLPFHWTVTGSSWVPQRPLQPPIKFPGVFVWHHALTELAGTDRTERPDTARIQMPVPIKISQRPIQNVRHLQVAVINQMKVAILKPLIPCVPGALPMSESMTFV